MPVSINFKICDNDAECGGIEVCPTEAIFYDKKKKTILIDNSKCISCGKCISACPIQAITVSKTDEEYKQIQKEIAEDPRTVEELFVNRYGAIPISGFHLLNPKVIEREVKNKEIVFIELFNEDSIECLAKSIQTEEIQKSIKKDSLYYKVESNKDIEKEYNITKLPALLVFKNGKYRNKIEGYYTNEEKSKLFNHIKKSIRSF